MNNLQDTSFLPEYNAWCDKQPLGKALPTYQEWVTLYKAMVGSSKTFEEIQYPDGRKSVTIHVNTLNLENPDDGDLAAQKVIEEQILPELGNRVVLVTVIHKETLMKATVKTKAMKVRQVAETLVDGFPALERGILQTNPMDFIVVEVEGDEVRVSSLI